MALIIKLDLDLVKMYLHTQIEFPMFLHTKIEFPKL